MSNSNTTPTATPKEGWIEELADAEAAAKKNRSSKAQLRIATAASKLRQWKKLKTAANLGLVLEPSATEKRLLTEYVSMSQELHKESFLERETLKELRKPGVNHDLQLLSSPSTVYTNLNMLQYAAVTGDIPLLEETVALGAALDFPVLDRNNHDNTNPNPGGNQTFTAPAPLGSTALVLACAAVAMIGEMEPRDPIIRTIVPAEVFVTIDRTCECAIRLVYLGADCTVQLKLPPKQRNDRNQKAQRGKVVDPEDDDTSLGYREMKLDGKTALEIATISGRQDLIHAMEQMKERENAIQLTQCRCGSRLPWRKCHGPPITGQSPLYNEGKNGRLQWRSSPKATCSCKLTEKEHYKCCWYSSTPTYQNDASGELCKTQIMSIAGPQGAMLKGLISRMKEIDPNGRVFPGSADEFQANQCAMIRTMGLGMYPDTNGRRNRVKDWDPEVFASVMERIENFFPWNDCHWQLDKPELLQRTKEWNNALEQYCNDIGLTGAKREAVVKKHTASPCAPCANPLCSNMEVEPKEFLRCGQCKAVAYCSRECQKKNWKNHKQCCIKR
jgi:hypothetical protein